MVSNHSILFVYFLGIFLSFAIGVWGYLAIRGNLHSFLCRIVPIPLKTLVWRMVKFGLVTTVLVGGMTSKYYSCSGGYKHLKESKLALFGALTNQLTSSLHALITFLLILLALSLLFLVIIVSGSRKIL